MPHAKSQEKFLSGTARLEHIGKLIIIRDFAGQYLERVVWDFDEMAVYVIDRNGYEKLISRQKAVPIGFPRRDVFEYDHAVMENSNWSRLREWSP